MWLAFSLIAYILFAAATITDKYLLQRTIPDARVYAFYTGILGLFAFALAPFGFQIPHPLITFLGLFAGALFVAALFLFFSAIKAGEVSRVGIALGGFTPLFTLGFTYIGTSQLPERNEYLAFALLLTGSMIIAFDQYERIARNLKIISLVASSSFLFGLYFTVAKFLFTVQPFVNAFIWIKIGGAFFALLFLVSPQVREVLFAHKKNPPKKATGIFLTKNAAGGIGALLLHLSISAARIGGVAVVNALQGAQFALVFLAALFLTKIFPGVIKEKIDAKTVLIKSAGTAMIVAGIILLAIA